MPGGIDATLLGEVSEDDIPKGQSKELGVALELVSCESVSLLDLLAVDGGADGGNNECIPSILRLEEVVDSSERITSIPGGADEGFLNISMLFSPFTFVIAPAPIRALMTPG